MASNALIGALLGFGKAAVIDRAKEDRARQLKADMLRFGPLAGNTSEVFGMGVPEADILGSTLSGASFGLQQDELDEKAGKKGSIFERILKDLGKTEEAEARKTATTGTSAVNTTGELLAPGFELSAPLSVWRSSALLSE